MLGSLARMVATGSRLGDHELGMLLLGANLDAEQPMASEELKRWGKILTAFNEQPSVEMRRATVEALSLRGLPEAPVLLAVDTVANSSLAPVAAGTLKVVPERLDFGLLPSGEGVSGELEVEGGPGQIMAESDQVRVSHTRFGNGTTRVRVEVPPLTGGLLWTSVKLVTADETVEVPLLAQWGETGQQCEEADQPTDDDTSVVVEPGSLESAVREARAGAVLYLRAGEHRLSRPLEIDKPLSLIGEGMDEARVLCEGEAHVVKFEGDGPFVVHDLGFEHEGSRWARVVEVVGGEVDIRRCRFAGGVWDEGGKRGGSGLRLRGRTRGLVANCESVRNGRIGISIEDQGQPTLEANTCRKNEWGGISYSGDSSGTARRNTCNGNVVGIEVGGQAQPTLEANTCQENMNGIGYGGSAAGVARHNVCSANELQGISIVGQVRPTLETNTCQENKWYGISYAESAAGIARHNVCSANGSGIFVGKQAQPTLEANTCQENKTSGIAYDGSAGGTARHNVFSANERYGIYLRDQAQPILEANTCTENKKSGILYFDSAAGVARRNVCSANESYGIFASEQARPTLEANTCEKNRSSGIYFTGSAAGTARQNVCSANEGDGISVRNQARPTLEANTCQENKGVGSTSKVRQALPGTTSVAPTSTGASP